MNPDSTKKNETAWFPMGHLMSGIENFPEMWWTNTANAAINRKPVRASSVLALGVTAVPVRCRWKMGSSNDVEMKGLYMRLQMKFPRFEYFRADSINLINCSCASSHTNIYSYSKRILFETNYIFRPHKGRRNLNDSKFNKMDKAIQNNRLGSLRNCQHATEI